ncbi:MAG: flavodoxin-dependent (E)-4-hydroxy-3-methylbut-2-enyl-diphosphate synthase [Firmicutes bacterium]|nr:flavodoxin-dependent (E)-4-hydroxy-3-methylbut-2-enyl-diphosphate synthase [Bacillota bacterium]
MTRAVKVRDLTIGGGAPVVVQGMTKGDTRDVKGTLDEIARYQEVGAEVVRVAVPDMEAAQAVGPIVKGSQLPIVADIHFDYRLALEVLRQGVDKLRLNPGNIGEASRVETVVKEAKVRGGSYPHRRQRGLAGEDAQDGPRPDGGSARQKRHEARAHSRGPDFHDIIISLKASDVPTTLAAYRLMAKTSDYPLHVGLTEAGASLGGTVKSAVGIGTLLAEGIGDTIRVSMTGPGEEEIRVAWEILKALKLRERGVDIVACPTCGRIQFDMWPVVNELEKRLASIPETLTVAIMGCAVNGPGEAKDAKIGIAGGKHMGLLYRDGQIVRRVEQDQMVEEVWAEVQDVLREARTGAAAVEGDHASD